ncbi:MAG: CBS domain-containing protein [Candidatus Rokubacteria bacterium]|nr:CBS domain-containing protein [Candidatus Rokubacteria bacterium]
MKVYEVMTRDVVTVRPETPIQEAAQLMVSYGVSGLPVVDDRGSVVGILSEGDLILRQKRRERVPWWRSFFDDGERLAREYQKAMGTTAGEVMTRSVICVSPDLPIESVAVILDERRIRRLPVVADGQLVGIVSRGDLIKALATAPAGPVASLSDGQLVREMKDRIAHEPWASNRGIVAQAKDGIVSLWGVVDTEAQKSALVTMARAIPGVKGVDSHLVVRAEVPYLYWV